MSHNQAYAPNRSGGIVSRRLWDAIMTTPKAPTAAVGSRIRNARATIDHPIAQITWRTMSWKPKSKDHPKVTRVTSTITSQSPRVQRNLERSFFDRPRESERKAPVPARKTKTGAQKCVIQRVK